MCNLTSIAFNAPQDIEWAIVNNKLYLLQSRPITTLKNIKPTNGILTTWDNSNICESYGGIVSPLTYSFIKKAYSEVYKQMCFMFKVDKNTIEKNQYTWKWNQWTDDQNKILRRHKAIKNIYHKSLKI